jgi:[ribosomal protein S5]-alanine N-acetyltransferase
MQNNLATERLQLQTLTIDECAFIHELVNTPGWLRFIGDRNVHSEADAVKYIHKILQTPNLFYWVVRKKEDQTAIGIITFIKRNYLDHFDIGFAFLPAFNGQGYAFEAANAVYTMVRKESAHQTVLATTIPQNVQSIKLLTKLGLQFAQAIEVENETLHVYSNAKLAAN